MPSDFEKNDAMESFDVNFFFFVSLVLIMIWFGLFPSVLLGYWFFITFPFSWDPIYLLLLIPIFFVLYGVALLSALFSTKISIWLVHKFIAYPKLGSYPKTMSHPQIRAFTIKGNLRNFGQWLFYFFHVRFLRTFWMRQMGAKIGKNVRLGRFVLAEEFIEVGDNTLMSDITILPGHLQDQTHLTFNQTTVGKNCIFEPLSGGVGASIGDNSIFRSFAGAMKGMNCRGNAIYADGIPCKKVGEYSDLSSADIEALKQKILKEDKIDHIKEKNAPIKINEIKLFLLKVLAVVGGIVIGLIFPILYSYLFQVIYIPGNHLLNILLLIPIPIIFILSIAFFAIGTLIFIKIIIKIYDKKADIPEGWYELDDPRAKYFKIKYLLRMFGLRLFHGTPFSVADAYAMKFMGNVKLGYNVWMNYATVDPQYLEIGEFTTIGQGARIHTHDIIDGKLYIKKVKIGRNCLIGTYTHIKPGVEIADDSVCAVLSWFRKNKKCKRPALWVGKPAAELPLSILTKAAKVKGRYID